jgi:hypothetical protein
MNVFQLMKSVLDELYARIPEEKSQTKDDKIRERLTFLEQQYAGLTRGNRVDYSDITTRFAYIYRYVTSHANLVYQLVSSSTELAGLFDRDKVNVACIGGGPGSEFLGILKFIIHEQKRSFLRCTLFDKEQSWGECWNDVDEKLESQLRITTIYQPFDVTNPSTWVGHTKYLNSDLFTMVYFMSEIASLRSDAEAFFLNLFENVKEGALLLYIDNNNPQFYAWFDTLAASHSIKVLRSRETRMGIDDLAEEKSDLGEYWEKFGFPKLTANIAFRICQKAKT